MGITMSIIALLFSVLLLRYHAFALQVTPGSTCAAVCLDNPESDPLDPRSSNTSPSDIICDDDGYDTDGTGIKYKNCINCLQKSNATSGSENDALWFLYNVRYAVDVCVYGFPNASSKGISSPCDIDFACEPLKTALEAGNLDSSGDQYEYCTAGGGIFSGPTVDSCLQCFSSSTNQAYMSNFITALKAGCKQKPAPGTLLGLSGTLFTDTLVNITDPPVNETSNDNDDSTGMTTGAIVGIAVGAALLFFGGTGLFWVYHRKQKRLYGDTLGCSYDPRSGNRSISPLHGGGFSSMEQKSTVLMSDYELRTQHARTNNAEYYDQLEKEMQIRRANYVFDSHNPPSGTHGALPTHPAYIQPTHSRQASRDASTQPPKPRTNEPGSYALQAYLSTANDGSTIGLLPPPPPGPPPAATIRDSLTRGPSPNPEPSRSRNSSLTITGRGPSPNRGPSPDRNPYRSSMRPQPQTQPQVTLPPPPPPPPRMPKVPTLVLPSIPRLRVPKKYAPPQIKVEGATPIDTPSGSQRQQPFGIEISKPLVDHDARFVDNAFEGHRSPLSATTSTNIVEQTAVDRRPWAFTHEVEMKTGKSSLYG
ncbi:hypothetical protein F5B20DRAFT_524202 [Whalleya microplaca]|nr:hypothetical protein F5B20DRAFT_524202 [Whalleya microplaca]